MPIEFKAYSTGADSCLVPLMETSLVHLLALGVLRFKWDIYITYTLLRLQGSLQKKEGMILKAEGSECSSEAVFDRRDSATVHTDRWGYDRMHKVYARSNQTNPSMKMVGFMKSTPI